MSRLIFIIAPLVLLLAACGEPTDRPEDCTTNQYFDESRKLCVTCAAIPQPECNDGCGFSIVTNSLGCPEAECLVGEECRQCDEESNDSETRRCTPCDAQSYISPETLLCTPCVGPKSCDGNETEPRIVDGRCTLVCP